MKILVIPSWYPNPNLKTQGLFFRDQALALSKKYDVEVIYCHRGSLFYKRKYSDDGLKTYYWGYKLRAGKYIGMLVRICMFIWMYVKYQKANNIDIIHCHSVAFNQDGSAGIAGVILGKLYSLPVIITEHATVFKSENYGYFEKKIMQWALKNSSSLITVSDGLKESLEEFTGRGDIATIPNTLDVSVFQFMNNIKVNTNDQEINICSVGYLMEKKGFDRLILAVERIKKKFKISLKVKLIGDGPERSTLTRMIKCKGLTDNFEMLGELDKEQIAFHMSQCDLFILLSRVETFGVVIIEALACGLYCIATESGGPEYILGNDKLGKILTNTDDVEYFAEQIAGVITSNSFKLNQATRIKYVDENYSYNSFLNSFDKLILSKYELS